MKKVFLILSAVIFFAVVSFALYVNLFLGRQSNTLNIVVPVGKSNPSIEIFSPKLSETITSPLKITGVVRGDGWSGFEGQVGTVHVLDANGKELASAILSATTTWTTLPTNFEAMLSFTAVAKGNGTLVFHNENPSGMPEKDKTFILPIKFK